MFSNFSPVALSPCHSIDPLTYDSGGSDSDGPYGHAAYGDEYDVDSIDRSRSTAPSATASVADSHSSTLRLVQQLRAVGFGVGVDGVGMGAAPPPYLSGGGDGDEAGEVGGCGADTPASITARSIDFDIDADTIDQRYAWPPDKHMGVVFTYVYVHALSISQTPFPIIAPS